VDRTSTFGLIDPDNEDPIFLRWAFDKALGLIERRNQDGALGHKPAMDAD